MRKTLVFGCGWLGTRMIRKHGWLMSGADIIDPGIGDILDAVSPDVVINAAAKCGSPNIDGCLLDKTAVYSSNVTGPHNLAEACKERCIHFVHMSSGCLWEGGEGYTPDSVPEPPSYYSETKAYAEAAIKATGVDYTLVRMRMPLDDRPHTRNLITKLLRYDTILNIPCSLTTVPLFLDVMKEIVDKRMTGTYHVVQPGSITNKDILRSYEKHVGPAGDKTYIEDQQDLIDKGVMTEVRSFAVLETSAEHFETPFLEAQQAVDEVFKEYYKWL